MLLIHGAEDPRMPAQGTRQIFAAASEPKSLWLIDGAGHMEGYGLAPQAYLDRVVDFFQAHLR